MCSFKVNFHFFFLGVCTSCDPQDLAETDQIAANLTNQLAHGKDVSHDLKQQYEDNHLWITRASDHKLVVGSQARILYSVSSIMNNLLFHDF
jgi:urocanate hydratase